MSGETKIRWTNKSWNPGTGCTQISAGCDHCYALTLAERYRGNPSFPVGFDPMIRPHKLREPAKWREPCSIFVNSMSDLFHPFFDAQPDFLDSVFDLMCEVDRHTYQVLTKRPRRMRDYLLGTAGGFAGTLGSSEWSKLGDQHDRHYRPRGDGYLARRGLRSLPEHIWPGVTIENDLMTFRADVLREIPAPVRMLSCEPLLTPLPSLNLDGIGWVIVGGESGPGFRPMPHEWAAQIRNECIKAGIPFFFKQSASYQTEKGQLLEGRRWEQRPILERDLLDDDAKTRLQMQKALGL